MRRKVLFLMMIISVWLIFPGMVKADLASGLKGMILLSVEENGEAWYVYPEDKKRYFLGRPADAFAIMRRLGLGISEWDFQRLAQDGMPVDGDMELARRLSGRIILQAEKNGEAWYVYPKDLKKYYLGRPIDAFAIMRRLGLGISRENLAFIHKPGLAESIDSHSRYEHLDIRAGEENFSIDLVEISLLDPDLSIITDTAVQEDCRSSCPARSLGSYILDNNGFAGINGTYFEAYDKKKLNYYFYPVYNSREKILINESELKYWTTGPIMAWDENNRFYYYKDSREFKSVDDFEKSNKARLQAALGNKPRLIENKQNMLIEFDIDEKQRNARSSRNAIAYKENHLNPGFGSIYLVAARNATVPDLANILKEMKVDYALNLDGGYSSALWYNGEYMVRPGRDIPNALIFKHD